jgi:hypothetical protein
MVHEEFECEAGEDEYGRQDKEKMTHAIIHGRSSQEDVNE